MLLHPGEENPLALPCPCHPSPAPRGYPSTVRHHTRTCGREPLAAPPRVQETLQLLTAPAPRPPAPLPCDAAGTHRLICAGCLVLLKEKMPGASHNAQRAEPPPCSSCLPLQMATPPHRQDQGNVATAIRNSGTPSLSHPHPTGSKQPWFVARMAALCRQVGTLSSDS